MKRINRLWLGVGASVAVIGVGAVVTLGTTTLLGVTLEESEPKPAEGVQTGSEGTSQPGPREVVETGYRLSFCIQAVGIDPSVEAVAKARIETALLEVMRDPHWKISGLGVGLPLVDIGCPEEPLPSRPGIVWKDAQIAGGTGTIYTVPEPGPYNKFVFIMPLERIDTLLGGPSIRHAPQDYVSDGSELILERASGMYITPEEVQDIPFLVKHLTIAAGLADRYPEPSPE